MKKEQQDICDSIKLTQAKMTENERALQALHAERARLKVELASDQHNLSHNEQCLPLRRQQPHIYDGPVITVPFIAS